MNNLLKLFWFSSWMFCLGMCVYTANTIGWDVIMPYRIQVSVVLSFFGPPLLWCIVEIIKPRKP